MKTLLFYAVIQILPAAYDSYDLRCPEAAEWNFRPQARCLNKSNYHCLPNIITNTYEEGCTGELFARSGLRAVISGQITRDRCPAHLYQPIMFTNKISNCMYKKNVCNEQGQLIFSSGNHEKDTYCSCNFTEGYAIITPPVNLFFCNSSIHEDCTCYLKKCPRGSTLLPDFTCSQDIKGKNKETYSDKTHVTVDIDNKICMRHNKEAFYSVISSCIIFPLVAPVLIFIVIPVLAKVVRRITNCLRKCMKIVIFRTREESTNTKKANFLMVVSLLYHVATPLARVKFDRGINPSEFRSKMAKSGTKKHVWNNAKVEKYHRNTMMSESSKELDLLLMVELMIIAKGSSNDMKCLKSIENIFISITEQAECYLTNREFARNWNIIFDNIQSLVRTESREIKERFSFSRLFPEEKVDIGSWNKKPMLECFGKGSQLAGTCEKNNFLKIVFILHNATRPAMKKLYDEMVQSKEMTSNQHDQPKDKMFLPVVQDSKKTGHLTQTEIRLLYKKADASSSDLSLKLLITILKTVKYPKGFTDIQFKDRKALINLDKIRTKIDHSPSGMLTKEHFDEMWDNIQKEMSVLKVSDYFHGFEWVKNNNNIFETFI